MDLRVPPGDDAAVLDNGTAITVDTLVEGVHFDARLTPEDVGYKTVAVSVSDLAAMGATPAWMVLSCSLPARDDGFVERFATGLGEAARCWAVPLIGGDTTRSPGPRVFSVTMGGSVERPATRAGGQPGDTLWVTGTLGLAAAGYLLEVAPPAALRALRRPTPRLDLGRALAAVGLCTAMMDLSDGLGSDLPRLCQASHVGATIHGPLPCAEILALHPRRLELQVAGGEDYELLFTAPPAAHDRVVELARVHHTPVTAIGTLTAAPGIVVDGPPWPEAAFTHFGGDT